MEKKNKNWCCEITNKTFKLFKDKEIYDDTCERGCIFFYWKQIGIDKKFCEECQRFCEKEEVRLEEDSKKEIEELEKVEENKNCTNCGKLINWKKAKDYIDCKEYKDENWDRGMSGLSACEKHQSAYCEEESCSQAVKRVYCSKRCHDELEDKDEKQYWLKKATMQDLNQEIWKREKLHKRIVTNCMDCRKETNQWDEEEIENATCPDCSAELIEQNKKWNEKDKKKKIECYKCGKTKLLGYRENYHKVYCKDCAKEYWEWRKKHFWFCADDCPQ